MRSQGWNMDNQPDVIKLRMSAKISLAKKSRKLVTPRILFRPLATERRPAGATRLWSSAICLFVYWLCPTQHGMALAAQQPEVAESRQPVESAIRFVGRFLLERNTRSGYLILKAEIAEGNHIYSLTQKGSPPPTKIAVAESADFRIVGNFHADKRPSVVENDPIFNNRVEKHTRTVQFFVPLELADGVDPAAVLPELAFTGQVCSEKGVCIPFRNRRIAATFGGYYDRDAEQNPISSKKQR
jgi:hypothetical protein